MPVFSDYSKWYDLLYRDKDYPGEANYVLSLIQRFRPDAGRAVEFGCGTGRHAWHLAQKGLAIHGVELSDDMLRQARALTAENPNLQFSPGDVRNVRLGQVFPVALSLFHVLSYQTANQDILYSLQTVREHLETRGIFIFDCWYGPAVLTIRPEVRIKRVQDDRVEVTRISEPVHHVNRNVVDVNFHLFVRDKQTGVVSEVCETHSLRYFSLPEIEMFLAQSGFHLLHQEEWRSGAPLGTGTWSACLVAECV